MVRVLGIDLGFRTGWGLIADGRTPVSGSFAVDGSWVRLGLAVASFAEQLEEVLTSQNPDCLAYAEPFLGRFARPETVGPLFAFLGRMHEIAGTQRVEVQGVHEGKARRALIGPGLPGRTKEIKRAALVTVKRLGWPARDDHAADALIVADFVYQKRRPGRAHLRTPLFQGKE